MAVFAIAVVRDEADIIARTVGQMAEQVDHVVVADNGSTDGTRDILADLGVEVIDDPIRGFYQGQKITHLAHAAAEAGADWVVPFDGDELWLAPPGQTVASVLAAQPPEVTTVGAVYWNHVATDLDDPTITDPVARIGWREMGNGNLLRVACRCLPGLVIEDGNHFASYGRNNTPGTQWPRLEFPWPQLAMRHYSLRSFDQFKAKAAKVTEGLDAANLHPAIATHWREWAPAVAAGGSALWDVWQAIVRHDPANDFTLTYDPAEGLMARMHSRHSWPLIAKLLGVDQAGLAAMGIVWAELRFGVSGPPTLTLHRRMQGGCITVQTGKVYGLDDDNERSHLWLKHILGQPTSGPGSNERTRGTTEVVLTFDMGGPAKVTVTRILTDDAVNAATASLEGRDIEALADQTVMGMHVRGFTKMAEVP